MDRPTTRVLAVLALLQTHGRMTGAELAQRLEVNIRTLRRYIVMLQDLGIPIDAERGRSGAYVLAAGYKLPPMMFTNEEALALTIGLIAARSLRLADTGRAVESALAKLERVMPLDLKTRVRALTETITLDLKIESDAPPREMVLAAVSSAAQAQRQVAIIYLDTQGERTAREIDPYGLAFYQRRWYVVAYCHLRHGLRSFRLDRIAQVETTAARFERPAAFNALSYVTQAIATLPRKYPFQILLKTDVVTAQEEMNDIFGVLEACDEGILLRGSTDNLDWLARQLAHFSFAFTIREPADLKTALLRHCERMARMAE